MHSPETLRARLIRVAIWWSFAEALGGGFLGRGHPAFLRRHAAVFGQINTQIQIYILSRGTVFGEACVISQQANFSALIGTSSHAGGVRSARALEPDSREGERLRIRPAVRAAYCACALIALLALAFRIVETHFSFGTFFFHAPYGNSVFLNGPSPS